MAAKTCLLLLSKANRQPSTAPSQPALSAHGQRVEAERRAREAAALRENLARRKAQRRSRRGGEPAGGPAENKE